MNYEVMWAVVDAHRRCADELEQTLRELTGDRPTPEVDKVKLYSQLIDALTNARDEMWRIADQRGHTVRDSDASRCNVFASRCSTAIQELQKWGEL